MANRECINGAAPTCRAVEPRGLSASAWSAVRLNASSGETLEEASLRQVHYNGARVFDNPRRGSNPKA